MKTYDILKCDCFINVTLDFSDVLHWCNQELENSNTLIQNKVCKQISDVELN